MRDLARPPQTGVNTSLSGDQDTHLQGRLLTAVQIIWILVAILALLVFVVGIPALYAQIQSVCAGNTCTGAQVSVEQARTGGAWYCSDKLRSVQCYRWYTLNLDMVLDRLVNLLAQI